MEPRHSWTQLDSPLELSYGSVNLLATEIGLAKVGVCVHKAGIDFNCSFEGLYSAVECAGFSTRHADDDRLQNRHLDLLHIRVYM